VKGEIFTAEVAEFAEGTMDKDKCQIELHSPQRPRRRKNKGHSPQKTFTAEAQRGLWLRINAKSDCIHRKKHSPQRAQRSRGARKLWLRINAKSDCIQHRDGSWSGQGETKDIHRRGAEKAYGLG
jgi:hypothetical protein